MMLNVNLELKEFTTQISSREASPPELSVVMPCLNEADTLEACVDKAQRALYEHEITGEIIVADNGSTDGSQRLRPAWELGSSRLRAKDTATH